MVKMLNVEVRTAAPQDSEELVNLADKLVHLDDWSKREAMLKKSLEEPNCEIFVAEVEKKIVGFIELRVFPDFVEGAPIGIIQNIIVDENYRKLGIGSKLLQRAIEEAENLNAVEIHVWTEFDNQPAINFYTKHGFKKRAILLEK
jgi:ribosomal protein S18 acetylase RimI-like enzyme